MEKRRFGRTEHMSTVAILGAAAFGKVEQAPADKAMELVLKHGVNHIDVAPSYGNAEERLASWMASHRSQFFIGCKTTELEKKNAKEEMMRSLKHLGIDHFDLYQIHAVTNLQELDDATRSGGALEAIIQAKEEGLTRFVGITGHGVMVPEVLIEALNRYEFDSVLFPINFIQFGNSTYRENSMELLRQCKSRDVGIMIIKSITKGPWGEQTQVYDTWYEPFTEESDIQQAISFVLSQDVTGICTVGDTRLLPLVLNACENFTVLSEKEQDLLIQNSNKYEPLFKANKRR